MPLLSVVLATYNEAKNLPACLQSVKSLADEIIIVDGQSSDNTRDIAEKFCARVIVKPNPPIFHINKQIALNEARGDWILQLDADEVVDRQLSRSIKKSITQTSINGYYLKRKNYFLSRWLKKGGQYPDPVIRLVRRGFARFPQKSVHEQIQVSGPVATLSGHLLHYTAPTFSRYLKNSNRYTTLTSHQLHQPHFLIFVLIKPLVTFFSLFFRHLGFLDGFPGFVFALFSAFHWPIAYFKTYENRS